MAHLPHPQPKPAPIEIVFGLSPDTLNAIGNLIVHGLGTLIQTAVTAAVADAIRPLKEKLASLEEQIMALTVGMQKFVDDTNASFTKLGAGLDNIAADEVKLAKDIQDLKDAIAAGNSNLNAEDQAALDDITVRHAALADKVQAIADSVPDEVTPPVA